MKRKITLFFLMFFFILNSCDPGSIYFNKDTYIDEIERIELVKYNNDNYKMVDSSKVELKFDSSKVEKIEILDDEKTEEFLLDFEKIVFHLENDSVNEPTGYCLIWYLKNGNFIVFSDTSIGNKAYSMAAEFDASGRFVNHLAHFASRPHYEKILRKYFSSYDVL